MSAIKMFFNGDLYLWSLKYGANFKSKKAAGLPYAIKSDKVGRMVARLRKNAYTKVGELSAEGYVSAEPLSFDQKLTGEHIALCKGKIWAKNTFDCMWVHCTGDFQNLNGDSENLYFKIDLGGEGLIYDKQGNARQGITNFVSEYSYDLGKPGKLIVQSEGLFEQGKVDFWIDAAANDLFGKFQENAKIKCLDIVKLNENIRALAYDVEVLLSAYDYADKALADKIYSSIKEVYSKCKHNLSEEVAGECRLVLKPYFEQNCQNNFEYTAIGHAHLDLAWLWPIRESKRKGLRTFSTQIMNMERYPDYYFGASQAQLFDWVKKADKVLYEKVCQKVKSGQLEVQGATWVEMDSNLIGLESMIRQFYYGKKYFRQEFGLDMKILWLPDSFGYSACLPQVMKLADVPYFLTQKLSWNTVTKFPYHTFNWVGLDGSKVFAHMLPNNSYNSPNRADNLVFGVENFQEKKISNKALTLFGIGDGGAGPGFEHIERAQRLRNLPPIPKVKMGKAVDFFDELIKEKDKFSDYQGELYLEKHQGTYTTQARVKYYNRKCEFALRNYELLAALVETTDLPIDLVQLEEMWKEILLYQFHDILPGSSIDRVYEECVPRYKLILDTLNDGINKMLATVANGKSLFNPNSFDVEHYFKKDDKWQVATLNRLSVTPIDNAREVCDYVRTSDFAMENDCLKIVFDKGEIVSYFDKKLNREFVGQNGRFLSYSAYKDFGDCWDMRKNYAGSKKPLKFKNFKLQCDGVQAVATSVFELKGVQIAQQITLTGNENFARVHLHINNNRDRSMLRVAFESNIKSDRCAFNTQSGHIFRKTTENTKTEVAQYEVSGQKFVDLSNEDAGLAIVNDCKYGFRCKGAKMHINLLRSPHYPAHNVDKGEFDINLAIFTHKGNVNADVYKLAYMINNPIVECEGEGTSNFNKIEIDNENVVIESVKIADNGGVIVRIYNSNEEKQSVCVNMPRYEKSEIVNLLEEKISDANGNFVLNGFEILNLRFYS